MTAPRLRIASLASIDAATRSMTFLSRRRARAAVAARLVPNLSVSALSALILTGYAVPFSARAQIAATPRPVLEEQRQQERERALSLIHI